MSLGFGQVNGAKHAMGELAKTRQGKADVIERLSSGIRIQGAGDDAAALAVASKLNNDKAVHAQAVRNVNDGISTVSMISSAADQLENILTRVSELASRAANSTTTDAQREVLNAEAQALSSEYNRILRTTSSNGQDLLAGADSSFVVQAGYQESKIEVDLSYQRSNFDNVELGGSGLSAGDDIVPYHISYDARYVLFSSRATDLDSSRVEADGSKYDTFVQDTVTGTVEKISVGTINVAGSNTETTGHAVGGKVSDDGRYAVFYETGTGELGTAAGAKLLRRDLETDTTILISVNTAGAENNGALGVGGFSMSADGRYVVFESESTNLDAADGDATRDIFLRDTVNNTTTLISKSSAGVKGNGTSSAPRISEDGKFISYTSAATNLVSGDTNGLDDIFMYEVASGTTTIISLTAEGAQRTNGTIGGGDISADGRYLTFETNSTDYGISGGNYQIYRYDRQTGEKLLVSKSDAGAASNGDSRYSSISADGSQIVYRSRASNLVNGDTNGYQDIFVTDIEAGETKRVSVSNSGAQADGNSGASTLSTPAATYNSFVTPISGNGKYVFFDTAATNLTSGTILGDYAGILAGNPIFESTTINPLTGVSLTSETTAQSTLDNLSSYHDEITILKGKIAAASSRLDLALTNVSSLSVNYADAEAKILNADVATDLAKKVTLDAKEKGTIQVIRAGYETSYLALRLLKEAQSLPL